MDDNTIFEAFDLTQDTEEPVAEGENEQEVAEPAAQEAEKTEEAAKPEQTPEERSRQAYGRRQRELEDARNSGRNAAVSEVDELLKRLGMNDPESGEPVDTLEKLKSSERRLSDDRIASGRGTEADMRRIAREEMQRTAAPATPQLDEAQVKQMVDSQIAEIHAIDPGVSKLDDILQSEHGPAFRKYVGKGLTLVEAWRLAAADRIAAGQRSAAAQQTRNRQDSKSHLSATVTHGQGAVAVPTEELELFKAMMPDATDAEIEKRWNADRKRFRR